MANAVEIRLDSSSAEKWQALRQLGTYIQQIFKYQFDRRFNISFTLCLDELDMYLFDRSCVVTMEESIDIHKVLMICLESNTREPKSTYRSP
jgi:hypothetical protein